MNVPRVEFPVRLYVNNQERACFKSLKEAVLLLDVWKEQFIGSSFILKIEDVEVHYESCFDEEGCWYKVKPDGTKTVFLL